MKGIIRYILILLIPTIAYGQEFFTVDNIDRKDGLYEREVRSAIRNDDGYFYLMMRSQMQRWDGLYFNDLDMAELVKHKTALEELGGFNLMENGKIVFESKGKRLFYIEESGLDIKSIELDGRAIVSQGSFYKVVKASGSGFDIYEGNDIFQDSHKLLLKDIGVEPKDIVKWEDQLFIVSVEDRIYQYKNDKLTDFKISGRVIENGKDLYLFTGSAVFKWKAGSFELFQDFQFVDLHLRLLKKDKGGNILFTYGEDNIYQVHAYLLTKKGELQDYSFLLKKYNTFIDLHADDFAFRLLLVGHYGVRIVTLQRDGSKHIFKDDDVAEGGFGNLITSIVPRDDSTMFFIRENSGPFIFNVHTGKVSDYMKELSSKFQNNGYLHNSPYDDFVYGYRYDSNINSSDLVRFRISGDTPDYTTIHKDFDIGDVCPIDQNRVLIGGRGTKDQGGGTGVLYLYDFDTGESEIIIEDTIGRVTSVYQDTINDNYWVGTLDGLYRLDSEFNTVSVFNRKNSSIRSSSVRACLIYCDKLVVATLGGGLFIVDVETNSVVKNIGKKDGLEGKNAVSLMIADGKCWVGTYNGVAVIDSSFNVVRSIGASEGLVNREFNTMSTAEDKYGNIYLGTINGIQSIDPQAILNWKLSNDLDITDVFEFKRDVIERVEWDRDEISISNLSDSLVFQFNWTDYKKYPLESNVFHLDADCDCPIDYNVRDNNIIVSTFPDQDFNLIFKDGKTGQELKSIKVNYKMDYSKWIQILGGIGLVGFLSYLFSSIYINYNKKIESDKTEMNRRFANLRLSALQSQMNPHFIFNSLGAIQYFIQINNEEMADEYLSNFALLMRKILEASKEKFISLEDEIQLLKLYLDLEELRFEDKFTTVISVDDNVDREIKLPPMIIQPFIENAINHGLNHLVDRKGEVLLLLFKQEDENTLVCTIEDNGIGRDAALKYKRKNHKSRGMQIINERMETFNIATNFKISYKILDKLDASGEASGTKVVIKFINKN